MENYKNKSISEILRKKTYPGRGIIIGKSADSKNAVIAYFIMGRSENSRNRIFREENDDIVIYPFDESKVSDPSLIIYSPIRVFKNNVIVTNGDQTDTIYESLNEGHCFKHALKKRSFEPDAPNYTPRISGILNRIGAGFSYEMSILKSVDENGSDTVRNFYMYPMMPGLGHFIHTYMGDGNPLPTFCGEPVRIEIPDDINEFAGEVWNNLNSENKISCYVRKINSDTGKYEEVMFNKNA